MSAALATNSEELLQETSWIPFKTFSRLLPMATLPHEPPLQYLGKTLDGDTRQFLLAEVARLLLGTPQ